LLLENTLGWQPSAQEICLRRSDDPAKQVTPSAVDARTAVGLEEDSALAEACRTGSLSAYEQLYQKHGARLKSIALNLLGNVHDAEDAVQEAFLKVHRGIRSFKGQSAFSTWIYRILLNSCYDLRRKKQRRQETPEQDLEPQGTFEAPAAATDHPLRLALEACVARLSPHYRNVFLLFEVEGFSHSEIAAMLGISEASSKNMLYQAKRKLRRLLSESEKSVKSEPS